MSVPTLNRQLAKELTPSNPTLDSQLAKKLVPLATTLDCQLAKELVPSATTLDCQLAKEWAPNDGSSVGKVVGSSMGIVLGVPSTESNPICQHSLSQLPPSSSPLSLSPLF